MFKINDAEFERLFNIVKEKSNYKNKKNYYRKFSNHRKTNKNRKCFIIKIRQLNE